MTRIPQAPRRELNDLRDRLRSGATTTEAAANELERIIAGTAIPHEWRLSRFHVAYRFRTLTDQEICELLKIYAASNLGIRGVPNADSACIESIEALDGGPLVERHDGVWRFRSRYVPFGATSLTLDSKANADANWLGDLTWSLLQNRPRGRGSFRTERFRLAAVVVPDDVLSDYSRCLLACIGRAFGSERGWEQIQQEWRSLRKLKKKARARFEHAIDCLRRNGLIEGRRGATPSGEIMLTLRGQDLLARESPHWCQDGSVLHEQEDPREPSYGTMKPSMRIVTFPADAWEGVRVEVKE